MSESALQEGALIAGRYRLDHHLGEGGMGTVWAATHTVTRRSVAMKFLKDSVRHRKDLRERFLREAATASALKHPNVVEIIDVFDFEEQSPVMVMELLRGETLGQKLQRDERLSLEETAALLVPVVSAVGAAHAFGIVHRDLKPENLFLVEGSETPAVKVLDFGIAKLTAERYLEGGPSALLTESGSLLGTPCYMAPEQASGEHPVDHRADVWSLGVILYECLSGSRPIEGESLPQVVARLMSAGIMPLERIAPELPGEVTGLVKQMLTRDLGRRTASLVDVSKTLGRYTNVRAPEFGVPSTGRGAAGATPKTMESAKSIRPNARIVASPGADPRGPTMLSSPPVNSSLQLEQAPAKSNRGAYVAGVAVVAVALGGWVWGATRQSPGVQTTNGELPMLPQAAVKPAQPVESAAAPAPVAPSPAAVASASAAVASAPAAVPSTRAPVSRKSAAAGSRKPRAQSTAVTGDARRDPNEDVLFSGTK
jgi:serine/threonine protein kinase